MVTKSTLCENQFNIPSGDIVIHLLKVKIIKAFVFMPKTVVSYLELMEMMVKLRIGIVKCCHYRKIWRREPPKNGSWQHS